MKPPFETPKVVVTYGWRRYRDEKLKYVEMMFDSLSDYYARAMDSEEEYVLINSHEITAEEASSLAMANQRYDNTDTPIELGTK